MARGLDTTTVLFTDIVDSTALLSERGEDVADEVRRAHIGSARDLAERHGGSLVKNLGDGVMLVFDSAANAVAASVELQSDASRGPALRVGISAGDVLVEDGDYFGTPVVVAARLCARARGGQVLASRVVAELAGARGDHAFTDVGSLSLKGLADPVPACEVRIEGRPGLGVTATDDERQPRSVPLPRPLVADAVSFVGRRDEVAWFGERMVEVAEGATRLVLLTGDPGMGKTRLAATVAASAHEQGWLVLLGRCDPDLPYLPLAEMLGEYADAVGDATMRLHLSGPGNAQLLRLAPALATRYADLQPGSTAGGGDRFALLDAVHRWLASLASRQPVLVVVDDLHAADPGTLAVVHYLARSSVSSRLLIVGTVRSDLVAGDLERALGELRRLDTVSVLPLPGLGADEVGRLAADWAGHRVSPAVVERLSRDTGGNPHFVRELLRAATTDGAPGDVDRIESAIDRAELPSTVRGVLRRRLDGLSPTCQQVLRAASVLGFDVDVRMLATVVELPTESVLEVVEEAVAAGVLQEVAERPGHVRFDHDLARRAVHDDLGMHERARLHLRAADVLEDRPETSPAVLAQHLVAATPVVDPARTGRWCEAAGDAALHSTAFEAATSWYQRALEHAVTPLARDEVRLLHKQGRALWANHRVQPARRVLGRAVDLAEGAGLVEEMAEVALAFQGGVGALAFSVGQVDEDAFAILDRALARLGQRDSPQRARLLAARALGSAWHDLDPAIDLADQAVAMARRLDDDQVLADVLVRTAPVRLGPDQLDRVGADVEEALDLLGPDGSDDLRTFAVHAGVVRAFMRGELEVVHDLLARHDRLLTTSPDPYFRYWRMWTRACFATLRGEFVEAERLATEALEAAMGRQEGVPVDQPTVGAVVAYAGQLGVLRWHQGRLGEYAPVMHALSVAVPTFDLWKAAEALCWVYDGQPDRAQALLRDIDVGSVPRNSTWTTTMTILARCAYELRDPALAERLWSCMAGHQDLRDTFHLAASIGSFALPMALIAEMRGDLDRAFELYEHATAINEQLSEPLAVLTRSLKAGALLQRRGDGDVERAHALLEEARQHALRRGFGDSLHVVQTLEGGVQAERGVADWRDTTRALWGRSTTRARSVVTRRFQSAVGRLTDGQDDEAIEQRVDSEQRLGALVRAVALAFRPDRAFGFTGTITFSLRYVTPGLAEQPHEWTVLVDGQRARVRSGRPARPTVVLHLSVADFVRFVAGELGTVSSLLEGRVTVDGSLEIASRVPDMFGGEDV